MITNPNTYSSIIQREPVVIGMFFHASLRQYVRPQLSMPRQES